MKKFLFIMMLLIAPALLAAEFQWTVSAEEWARPRSGERILALQPLAEGVRAWMQSPGGYLLEIKYPGGEEGALWGEELRDWLISLGVPSSGIQVISGHVRNDEVMIVLRRRRDV